MVHLPDLASTDMSYPSQHTTNKMYNATIQFLQQPTHDILEKNESLLYYYGKKYNPKYRHHQQHKYDVLVSNWTWI